jgi:hypothetical protein
MFNIRSIFPTGRRLLKRRPTAADYERDDDEEYSPDHDDHDRDEEDMLPVPQPTRHRATHSEDTHMRGGGKAVPRDDFKAMESQMRGLIQEKNELAKRAEELERELDRTKSQSKSMLEQQQRDASHYRQTRNLLKARALDLWTADSVSSRSDVERIIGTMEGLNGEIQQAAIRLAEGINFEKRSSEGKSRLSEDVEMAYNRVREDLGSKMAKLLQSREHKEDRTIVVMGLQASMSFCCKWVISADYFDDSSNGRFLADMYRALQKIGGLLVDGKTNT